MDEDPGQAHLGRTVKAMKREKINYNGFLVYKRKGEEWWDIPYASAGSRYEKTICRLPDGQLVFSQGARLECIQSFEEGMKLAMEHGMPLRFY